MSEEEISDEEIIRRNPLYSREEMLDILHLSEKEYYEKYVLPSPEQIREMASKTGLSFKTIKKGKLLPTFEDLKTVNETKFVKDMFRCQLNDIIKSGFKEKVTQALTSLEEIIKKEGNEFPDDYHSWLKFGMNIKFLQPEGLELFKYLSSFSPKYNEKECQKFWHSLNPTYGNVGTIVNMIGRKKKSLSSKRKLFLPAKQKSIC